MRRLTRFLSALCVMLCLVLSAYGQERPLAKAITLTPDEFGDLAQALDIRKIAGAYELTIVSSHYRLRLDFYQRGKQVVGSTQSLAYEGPAGQGSNSGRFAFHLIDLDRLPLGGGKPGHVRIHAQVAFGKNGVGTRWEIPKSVFDCSEGLCIQAFNPEAGTKSEVPLFHAIARTSTIRGGGYTPAEVVRMNPDADVLVGVLEVLK